MKHAISVLFGAALSVAAIGTASAEQFLDFQVDEGSVAGAEANIFTADKLNGGFTEFVTFTSGSTFAAHAYANMGQFFADEGGTLVSSQLNGFGASGYGMYALFEATGTFSGLNFTGGTGQFRLFLDVDKNTTFGTTLGLDGVTRVTTAGIADDYEIAYTTSLMAGTGTLSTAPGAYNFDFKDFTLTTEGKDYFIAPRPFHFFVQVNGDNDAASGTGVPGDPLRVTGDVSAVFRVPEPGSLALSGLALLGLGLARRRGSRT